MKYTKEELKIIWLDSFIGLEYKHKREIYSLVAGDADVKARLEANKDNVIALIGENAFNTVKASMNETYMRFLTDGLERKGVSVVTCVSDDYPDSLKTIALPPFALYCKGDLKLLSSDNFAMVGSRKSLPVSVSLAKRFSETFCRHGLTMVTGIAEGVDSAVIDGALTAGGRVISVIAGGFDHVYPAANSGLLDKVAEKGLAVAEFPPEMKPDRFMFPIRNRIIAGLSKGVLIVSGRKKSGTLYTAEYAEEFGRDLFAVPYGVGVETGEGCNDLIKRGAMLCDSERDVLDYYGIKKKETKIPLNADEKAVIAVLKDGERHIEKISEAVGRETYEIQTVLAVLEIKGIVCKCGFNVYGLLGMDTEV